MKQIKKLFFVNPYVADIFRKNLEVIIMDCTYKTNKYEISLLICEDLAPPDRHLDSIGYNAPSDRITKSYLPVNYIT